MRFNAPKHQSRCIQFQLTPILAKRALCRFLCCRRHFHLLFTSLLCSLKSFFLISLTFVWPANKYVQPANELSANNLAYSVDEHVCESHIALTHNGKIWLRLLNESNAICIYSADSIRHIFFANFIFGSTPPEIQNSSIVLTRRKRIWSCMHVIVCTCFVFPNRCCVEQKTRTNQRKSGANPFEIYGYSFNSFNIQVKLNWMKSIEITQKKRESKRERLDCIVSLGDRLE